MRKLLIFIVLLFAVNLEGRSENPSPTASDLPPDSLAELYIYKVVNGLVDDLFYVSIQQDHTFEYYYELKTTKVKQVEVSGHWEIKGDTLKLYSPDLRPRPDFDTLSVWIVTQDPRVDNIPDPIHSLYTAVEGINQFLIRPNELIPISPNRAGSLLTPEEWFERQMNSPLSRWYREKDRIYEDAKDFMTPDDININWTMRNTGHIWLQDLLMPLDYLKSTDSVTYFKVIKFFESLDRLDAIIPNAQQSGAE